MTPTARGKIMRRIAELIEKHAEHLAQIEVRDNGKLISEMHAQTKYMPEWFYYYGGLADKIQGAVVPVDRPDHFTYILQRAGRRVRVHHAVELAADAGRRGSWRRRWRPAAPSSSSRPSSPPPRCSNS